MSLDSPKLVHIWYTTKRMQGLVYVRTHTFELLEGGSRVSQSRRVRICNDPTGSATDRRPLTLPNYYYFDLDELAGERGKPPSQLGRAARALLANDLARHLRINLR